MSTRQYIEDATTRHQVFLQRYGAGQSKEAVRALSRLRSKILGRLANEPTQFQAGRLSAVLDDIDRLASVAFTDMAADIKAGSLKLAKNEADFSAQLYNRGSSANFVLPSEAALLATVDAAPMPGAMVSGTRSAMTIDESLRDFSVKKTAQVKQVISDGVVLGDTTQKISSELSSVMSTLQRRQLDTLVRTVTNHSSSAARLATYEQNADILDGYQWIATLDNRTTMICAARDGKVYQVGMGPLPPAHWGCRSSTIPVVKDEFTLVKKSLGKRPSIGAGGAKQVGARTTYGGWLKKQPVEFVDEALGPARSKLFRSGKLTIDKFVDPTGRMYTLEQLAQMNQIAFQEI